MPTTLKQLCSLFKSEPTEEPASDIQPRERRGQPRFTAQFRGIVSGQNEEGQGRTLDISSGGCKIESDMKVEQGAKFECRLYIPGLDWPLRIEEATVRWVEGQTFGVGFTRITPEEFSKLKTVLVNLEEEE
jgi:hypothetical protein